MDTQTSSFHERYADMLTDTSEACRSATLPHVERMVRADATVLDVGSGSGRDVAALLELGLDAFGVEPNPAMRNKALSLHPSLRGRLRHAMLPELGRPFSDLLPDGFDAVICSAVLMHLGSAEVLAALASMVEQLRIMDAMDDSMATPVLLVSLPCMDSSRLNGNRDDKGRRFYNHDPEKVGKHLVALGMSLEQSIGSDAALSSTGTFWWTLVFRRAQ